MAIEKKFVREGYVKASLDEYFAKQLNRAGYGGMEVNRTPMGTQITVYAEKPGMVIGKAGKVIRKLTRDIDRMYDMDNPQIDAQEVRKPELNAQMMATRLASSIERGWYFRKAGHNAMRAIMKAGALGCEIVISGKLTGAWSRTEKIVEGYIKHAGKPVDDIVDEGFAVAIKKLGTLGCKVRIIPPGAVLPDSFKLKAVAEKAVSEVDKPMEAKASIKKLVSEEAAGEIAEVEEVLEEEPVKAETSDKETVEKEVSDEGSSCATGDMGSGELLENEERREADGVWQHKHAGHDYWHPIARIHREG
jgi:small subunit ribosomal protein S3